MGLTVLLCQCCSKCGQWISSISMTSELVRNTEPSALSKGLLNQTLPLYLKPHVLFMQQSLRGAILAHRIEEQPANAKEKKKE